jgi:hypothetical protein
VLLEAKGAKDAKRVEQENLCWRLVGEKGNRNCDQPAHKVRVAVAAIVQNRLAAGAFSSLALKPDLTDTAAHLVGVVMRRLA